jgi:1,3-beta-galactosyl-N-acetylhexosamine phosphorylase
MGVDREMGYGKSTAPLPYKTVAKHFILEDAEAINVDDFKNRKNGVFVTHDSTEVLLNDRESVLFAINTYGKGRAAYLTGLPYTAANVRLLLRLLYWVAGKEGEFGKWHSTNVNVECTAFPDAGKLIVLNNSYEEQKTVITNDKGRTAEVVMEPFKSKWFDIGGMFQI